MKPLDISISPRPGSHYAVMNRSEDTGFRIVSKPLTGWKIKHELGEAVSEMLRQEIGLECDDLAKALEALKEYMRAQGTYAATEMRFRPSPGCTTLDERLRKAA